MNSTALLATIVAEIRAIPEKLSGDDSPLADPWEEITFEVQDELSPYRSAYFPVCSRMSVHTLPK